MYKKIILACLSLMLVCAMMLNLTGCATTVQAANLMEGVTPNKVSALKDLSANNLKYGTRLCGGHNGI